MVNIPEGSAWSSSVTEGPPSPPRFQRTLLRGAIWDLRCVMEGCDRASSLSPSPVFGFFYHQYKDSICVHTLGGRWLVSAVHYKRARVWRAMSPDRSTEERSPPTPHPTPTATPRPPQCPPPNRWDIADQETISLSGLKTWRDHWSPPHVTSKWRLRASAGNSYSWPKMGAGVRDCLKTKWFHGSKYTKFMTTSTS